MSTFRVFQCLPLFLLPRTFFRDISFACRAPLSFFVSSCLVPTCRSCPTFRLTRALCTCTKTLENPLHHIRNPSSCARRPSPSRSLSPLCVPVFFLFPSCFPRLGSPSSPVRFGGGVLAILGLGKCENKRRLSTRIPFAVLDLPLCLDPRPPHDATKLVFCFFYHRRLLNF